MWKTKRAKMRRNWEKEEEKRERNGNKKKKEEKGKEGEK